MPCLLLISQNPLFKKAIIELFEDEKEYVFSVIEDEAVDGVLLEGLQNLPANLSHKPALWLGKPPEMLANPLQQALELPCTREDLKRALQGLLAVSRPASEGIMLGSGCVFYATERRIACKSGAVVTLTEKETALMDALLLAKNVSIKREELMRSIWGYNETADTHTLETHIYRLRAKLKECDLEELISTTQEGYVIGR